MWQIKKRIEMKQRQKKILLRLDESAYIEINKIKDDNKLLDSMNSLLNMAIKYGVEKLREQIETDRGIK